MSTPYEGVAVVPDQEKPKVDRTKFEMNEAKTKRAMFVTNRLMLMDQEKQKYMPKKRSALMLYDGVIDETFTNRKKAEVVSPMARTFVEAKTAEELKISSEYVLRPVDDEDDSWRAELLMETLEHVRRVCKSRAKRHELTRMKNIVGQSVKWKSFRSTMVKMNVTKSVDENGIPTEWEERDVPGESDIFEEVIDPINDFWIDPNAGGIHDALDCAIRFRWNHEDAASAFSHEMFDFEGVEAGSDGMVEGIMYFKKPTAGKPDMMCIYAWPSVGMGVRGMAVPFCKEVYYGGLPDEHKMLPFVTYVNVPTFTYGFFGDFARSNSGEAAGPMGNVVGRQKFWAYAGDPEILMDLIDLRTSFGRSLYKACDLAGRSLVLTKGNFRIDNSIDWEHGDQIVGGLGQVEASTFGVANVNAFTVSLDDIYSQMIQASGTDPRNLTDTKQKTLGETVAQRESQFTRLEATADYNNELAEVIDGILTHKLVQQYYTEPKIVRLTGLETDKELERFDEVDGEHPRTGEPLLGKQYRRIRTSRPMREMKAGKENRLTTRDAETYSFVARPEYIRSSDMDIAVMTKKRAGELQSLKAEQLAQAIEKLSILIPYTQAQPGQKPLVDPESLPPVGELLKEYWKCLGVSGKDKVKGSSEKELEKLKQERRNMNAMRKPIGEIPMEMMQTQPPVTVPPQQQQSITA